MKYSSHTSHDLDYLKPRNAQMGESSAWINVSNTCSTKCQWFWQNMRKNVSYNYRAASRRKGPKSNFEQNINVSIFCMNIILWIFVTFEYISCQDKLSMGSFTWCVCSSTSFATSVTSWYLRNDIQNASSVILYIDIIFIAKCMAICVDFQILHCSGAFERRLKTF